MERPRFVSQTVIALIALSHALIASVALLAADEPSSPKTTGPNPNRWFTTFPPAIQKQLDSLDEKRDRCAAEGKLEQAAATQAKIVSLIERFLGKDHIRVFDARQRFCDDLAAARLTGGLKRRYLAAIQTGKEALRVLKETGRAPKDMEKLAAAEKTLAETLGSESRARALTLALYGAACTRVGKFASARKVLRRGLSIANRVGFERHPIYAGFNRMLGWAEMNGGSAKEAKRLLLKSRDLNAALYGKKHWKYLVDLCYITLWYLENGNDRETQNCADEAYQAATKGGWDANLPKVPSKRCMRLRSVLIVFSGIRAYDEALATSKQLLKELLKPQVKVSSHSLADYYEMHASLLTKLGRKAEANTATQIAKVLRETEKGAEKGM